MAKPACMPWPCGAPADLPVLAALVGTLQGKTRKQQDPFSADTLACPAWVMARPGGWTGYASEQPPSPITLHAGPNRFAAIAHGFALAQMST